MLVNVVLLKLPTSGQSVAQFELVKPSDLIFVPVSSHLCVHFFEAVVTHNIYIIKYNDNHNFQ